LRITILNPGSAQSDAIAGHLAMASDRRGRRAVTRGAFGAALLLLALSACTPLIGGAALVGVVSIAALTSHCYDYLDVTVLDADGRKTCAATVTAINGGSQFDLASCYYTPLTDGKWTLRASLPGSPDTFSKVVVDHAHDCTRHVQSVELTLNRAGSVPAAKPARQSAPMVASPPPAATPASSALPTSSAPPPAAPAPAAAGSSSSDGATPSVGVFPNSETSH